MARLADDLPAGVVAARRGPYTLLLNFTDETQTVRVAGETLEVGPRDVRVLTRKPVASPFHPP